MCNNHLVGLCSSLLLFFTTILPCGKQLQAQQASYRAKGVASYYADKFNGRRTASGEIFDNRALTAAHRTLPFGTYVRVTNLANSRSVVVRINDRGPYAHGRLIDVSRAAALQLDMVRTGTARVLVEVVPGPDAPEPSSELASLPASSGGAAATSSDKFQTGRTYSMWGTERFPKGFGLQVGSYRDLDNAIDQCRTLIHEGKLEEVYIQVGWSAGRIYRVLVGAYASREEALQLLPRIQSMGMDGFPKRHFE